MIDQTTHKILYKDAAELTEVRNGSVALVVTSPPYPMIEMWDDSFAKQNHDIEIALNKRQPELAFELMHEILDQIWKECDRVLCEGGIACINIGDATRTLNDKFQLFSNHSRITSTFLKLGFSNLPNIIWRKQTNAPNKFMGSGMLAPGAYVTMEHEFVLIFRKGNKREFSEPEKKLRRESAFFWEERNRWFSDLWDLKGTVQILAKNGSRERSAAYPFEIPFRLINMFSIKGDTVLDPFLGTGTTTLAAIASGRDSIGCEFDAEFAPIIKRTLLSSSNFDLINNTIRKRIKDHTDFIEQRLKEKGMYSVKHYNDWFNFPVMTRQEKDLIIQFLEAIKYADDQSYSASYIQEAILDYQGADSLFSNV